MCIYIYIYIYIIIVCIYIYIYIYYMYTHIDIYIYIYIYTERERERDSMIIIVYCIIFDCTTLHGGPGACRRARRRAVGSAHGRANGGPQSDSPVFASASRPSWPAVPTASQRAKQPASCSGNCSIRQASRPESQCAEPNQHSRVWLDGIQHH